MNLVLYTRGSDTALLSIRYMSLALARLLLHMIVRSAMTMKLEDFTCLEISALTLTASKEPECKARGATTVVLG
jgi:hypothetical protein